MTKILVIDDEENIVQTLRYNLLREGYIVSICTDGRQGLALFEQENFDLVILDLMLPGISGLDIYRYTRNSPVPVLILSALEKQVASVAGTDMVLENYMTKPFNLRELLGRVRSLLNRSGRVV
jgi:DNA-binding response OmpR family regulator